MEVARPVGRPVQQMVGPQMVLNREMGAVRLVVSSRTMLKTLQGWLEFDMWGVSLVMVPVPLVAMVV